MDIKSFTVHGARVFYTMTEITFIDLATEKNVEHRKATFCIRYSDTGTWGTERVHDTKTSAASCGKMFGRHCEGEWAVTPRGGDIGEERRRKRWLDGWHALLRGRVR